MLKLSMNIKSPKKPMEVKALFFRYLHFAIVPIHLMFNFLTSKVPIPTPIKIRNRFRS